MGESESESESEKVNQFGRSCLCTFLCVYVPLLYCILSFYNTVYSVDTGIVRAQGTVHSVNMLKSQKSLGAPFQFANLLWFSENEWPLMSWPLILYDFSANNHHSQLAASNPYWFGCCF